MKRILFAAALLAATPAIAGDYFPPLSPAETTQPPTIYAWWTISVHPDAEGGLQCIPAKIAPLDFVEQWNANAARYADPNGVRLVDRGDEVDAEILDNPGDEPAGRFYRSEAACQAAVPAQKKRLDGYVANVVAAHKKLDKYR